jgi:hypothetical protein
LLSKFSSKFSMLQALLVLCSLFILLSSAKVAMAQSGVDPDDDSLAVGAPQRTLSYYVGDLSESGHAALGESIGTNMVLGKLSLDSLVILDYGYPDWNGTDCYSCYGADYFAAGGARPFANTDTIADRLTYFMDGFYAAIHTLPAAQLTIVVGVNNTNRALHGHGTVSMYNHGLHWGDMISDLIDYENSGPPYYFPYMTVVGGNDMEILYNTGTHTINWANGFAYVHDNSGNRPVYFDFGNCPGCVNGNIALGGGWMEDQVYTVAWGTHGSYPLPEIYNTTGANATQWENLYLYELSQGQPHAWFRGSVTQRKACHQVASSSHPCDPTVMNTPGTGYTQLQNALNSHSSTARTLEFSTDMMWQYP